LGSSLGGQAIIWTARNDQINLEANEFIGQGGKPIGLFFRKAKLECDVFALDIAEIAKLTA
jgi:hypothetical protein